MQRRLLGLFLSLVLGLSPFCYGFAEGQSPDPPPSETPVTTGNPDIPVDELALLLKPLTESQPLIEAEAWQALVQAKAEQIASAEISVKRQNQEIEKTEQIGETAESTSAKDCQKGKRGTKGQDYRALNPDVSLSDTYWKPMELEGQPTALGAGQRELHLILL